MILRPALAVAVATAVLAGALDERAAVADAAARVAVVVGNDRGHADDVGLRYAESDARRMMEILTTVGEMAPADVILLLGRTSDEIRAAVRQAEARLLASRGDGVLIVYYSGHADAEALHAGPTSLATRELQGMLRDSAVPTRVLMIDACRSGVVTALKGGHAGGPFELHATAEPNPRGLAIITSSAAGEDSQESDELKGSFFTHHLATGLIGAADADADGAVTLAEAFAYAARHTTGSTAATWAGPQHPTYRFDLGGREDLVLTRPRAVAAERGGLGRLTLEEPGAYFIRREGETGLTAELSSDAVERPVALPPGRYEVIRRARDHLMLGSFAVAVAESTPVTAARMRRVDFGRAVRKGSTDRVRALAVYADGGVRGSLVGLGPAAGGGLGARLDLHGLTLRLGVGARVAAIDGDRGTRLSTGEWALNAGVFRAFDTSLVTIAAGVELGAHRLSQTAADLLVTRVSYAASVAPAVIVELPIRTRFFLSIEGALPAYLMNVETDDRAHGARSLHLTYRLSAGAGGYL